MRNREDEDRGREMPVESSYSLAPLQCLLPYALFIPHPPHLFAVFGLGKFSFFFSFFSHFLPLLQVGTLSLWPPCIWKVICMPSRESNDRETRWVPRLCRYQQVGEVYPTPILPYKACKSSFLKQGGQRLNVPTCISSSITYFPFNFFSFLFFYPDY